jgi:hypothetical protein
MAAGSRLSGADDQLTHQLPRPFSVVADSAPNWFDRFYFNLHPGDGRPGPTLVLGAGRYINAGVMDGYACLAAGDEQRTVRVGIRIEAGSAPTRIAGLSWEVREPLTSWHLRCDGSVEGFELDAVWTARAAAYEVLPIEVHHGDGAATDFSHFFQPGTWEGTLCVDGDYHDVSGWFGMRDRSWGVRRTRERLGLHLWGGAQLADRCVAVLYNEGRDGQPVHLDGAVLPVGGDEPTRVVGVAHDLRTDDDGEFTSGVVRATLETGEVLDVEWTALQRGVYMSPAGYDGWHGRDHGVEAVEHERLRFGPGVRLKEMTLALTDKLCACRVGAQAGTGVFELALSRSTAYEYRPTI